MPPASDPRRSASFSRLAWSNLCAQSAEQMALAAAPIVAVLALGAGPGVTGLLQIAQTLPFLLFAIPAGMLADRVSRTHLMVGAETLRCGALLGAFALATSGALSWPLLALLGFLAASGTVAHAVAAPGIVPALVAPRALPAANARMELARTVALTLGPAVGGMLVGLHGASPSAGGAALAFGVAAALSCGAVWLLAGVREPVRVPRAATPIAQDIREGARFVFRHALLRPVFATQFVFNMAFFVLMAGFVPHAVSHLGLSAGGTGLVLAVAGVGMTFGALAAGRIMQAIPIGAVIAIGPLCGFIAALLMLATVALPSPVLAAASLFLFGAGPILWVIATLTLRQSVTPPGLLGRVSAMFLLATGARPLGALMGAALGAALGADACLVAAAALFLVQAVVILVSPVVRLLEQPALHFAEAAS